ncbi:MAG: HD domain-containing protein [Chitinispirillaceae bacterium]|nr:HD domain-containing protein [Chitinispirillaceae bacterium]
MIFFGNDLKRINHSLKVYSFANIIADGEKVSEKDIKIISMAAILHDIGIKEAERKYNSSAAEFQELEGPLIARGILHNLHIEDNIVERVCFIVAHHHTYIKIDNIDFQIVVEADFLVNFSEENINRDSINKIKEKFFSTNTAKELVNKIYLK